MTPQAPTCAAERPLDHPAHFATAQRIIGALASRTAARLRRCDALAADVAQAAWEELLKSQHRFLPMTDIGDAQAIEEWEGFVVSVVSRTARRASRALVLPVSGDLWRAHLWDSGAKHASTDALDFTPDTRTVRPDEYAIGAEFVRTLRSVMGKVQDPGPALRVALHGENLRYVAADAGVQVDSLRRDVRTMRPALAVTLAFMQEDDQ